MEFRIAATFTTALAKLATPGAEGGQDHGVRSANGPGGTRAALPPHRPLPRPASSGRYASAATSASSSTRPRRASSWPMSATTTMPTPGPSAAGSRRTRAPAPSRSWKCGSGSRKSPRHRHQPHPRRQPKFSARCRPRTCWALVSPRTGSRTSETRPRTRFSLCPTTCPPRPPRRCWNTSPPAACTAPLRSRRRPTRSPTRTHCAASGLWRTRRPWHWPWMRRGNNGRCFCIRRSEASWTGTTTARPARRDRPAPARRWWHCTAPPASHARRPRRRCC